MKYFLVLLLLFAVQVSAQTLSNESDVSVLHKKIRVNSKSLKPTVSPLSAQNENDSPSFKSVEQTMREMKDHQQQNERRIQQGLDPVGPRASLRSLAYYDSTRRDVPSYTYEIKVQNNGTKTIKKIAWEYVLIDRETNSETGKHQFLSATNLKSRKTDKLVETHLSLPIFTVDAKNAGKRLFDLFIEQVNITRIEYSDGSVWEADVK